jgi:AcrR family transcriptional regulator
MSPTNADSRTELGRRERKRLETRDALVRAALELFGQKGFDAVTVTDIAERADVDPSTFFRHFGSKEAVLFIDVADYVQRMAPALEARPSDEPLLDSLAAASEVFLGAEDDAMPLEVLRASLSESTPSIRAQGLVYREQLVRALAEILAARLGVDPAKDPRPYLVASTWIAAFEWYRTSARAQRAKAPSAAKALGEIKEIAGPALAWADEAPRGRRSRR